MKTNPKRIGIVGGGQLGRMLAMAAHDLGFSVIVLDPAANGPAAQVADEVVVGDFKDAEKIRELARQVDVLTFEIELADDGVLAELSAAGLAVHPSPSTLAIIKDKLRQKEFLRAVGIPVADFLSVDDAEAMPKIAETFGYPFVLKARFDSYDGRGNALVETSVDVEPAMEKLVDRPLYAERYVPFIKELSVVAARGQDGSIAVFPPVETIHENHICHIVIAPALVDDEVRTQAERLAMRVLEALEGVGVFAVEMFLLENGEILVNEIAPRVHNSGHHTLEACETSQFTQHVRAITGLPLDSVAMKIPAAVMVNILGDRSGPAMPEGIEEARTLGDVEVHIYGKAEMRPQRKMGHLTATGTDPEEVLRRALLARSKISI